MSLADRHRNKKGTQVTKAYRAPANTISRAAIATRAFAAAFTGRALPLRAREMGALAVRHRLPALLAFVSAAALMVLSAAPALAATGEEHPLLPAISQPGQFETATGVATDSHGDVYVAAYESEAVFVYGPAGEFLTEFETSANVEGPAGLAVDSSGDVYVNGREADVVKYAPAGGEFPPTAATEYKPDETAGQEENGVIVEEGALSVAVDPATQNVYVVVEEGVSIAEYAPDGTLLNGELGLELGFEEESRYTGVAVYGANGDVYASEAESGEVYVLNPAGTVVLNTIDGRTNPNFPFGFDAEGYLAIDQANGDVYVNDIEEHGDLPEFTPSGAFVSQIGPRFGPEELEFEESTPSGIAVDNSATSPNQGDVYVTSQENLYAFGKAPAKFPLTIGKAGSGASSGAVRCEVEGGPAEACAPEYFEGTEVALSAKVGAGAEFAGWSGDCSGSSCELAMEEPHAVIATFNRIQRSFVVDTGAGSGAGSVECKVGTGAPGACAAAYPNGTRLTLIASAASGSDFAGWSDGTGSASACTGTGGCTFAIGADTTLEAPFELTHALTVREDGSGSGSVSCNGDPCASTYSDGTTITLAAAAAPGSSFAGWSGAGCSGVGDCTVMFAADTSVTATFEANPAPAPRLTPPVAASCTVPKLAGESLGQAKRALSAAHCALGKVTKPKAKTDRKLGLLLVKSSSPPPGASLPAASKVSLKLGSKSKRKKNNLRQRGGTR
jgi:hypothetical protein